MVAAKARRKRLATGSSSVAMKSKAKRTLRSTRRAVERRPRAEGGGRHRLGRAACVLAILHERNEFRDGGPEAARAPADGPLTSSARRRRHRD